MTIYDKMALELDKLDNRSAWDKGVNTYAHELIESLAERAEYERRERREKREVEPYDDIREWLLKGAKDWEQYSYGGCALISNFEIAERLCTTSELELSRNGELAPSKYETWLDVQARALEQAGKTIIDIYRRMKSYELADCLIRFFKRRA